MGIDENLFNYRETQTLIPNKSYIYVFILPNHIIN